MLCGVEEADAGEYSCVSENVFGNDTAASVLTVNARGKVTYVIIISYSAMLSKYDHSLNVTNL